MNASEHAPRSTQHRHLYAVVPYNSYEVVKPELVPGGLNCFLFTLLVLPN